MRSAIVILSAAILSSCAAVVPTTPSSGPAAQLVPATITLSAMNGIGASAGRVYIVGVVRDSTGRGVGNVSVHYSTTVGAFVQDTVVADPGGTSQAVVVANAAATVTASVAGATASIAISPVIIPPDVPFVPPPPYVPPAPPTPTPGPTPVPTPTPTPYPVPGLVPTVTCTIAAHGASTSCIVSATYGYDQLGSSAITSITWEWADGVKDTVGGSPINTHTYTYAGTYQIVLSVTAVTKDGLKTASAYRTLIVP